MKLELERGRGDWLTVRVVEPGTASAADVALALYGTPEFAHLVVGSGARYSYVFPPGKQQVVISINTTDHIVRHD